MKKLLLLLLFVISACTSDSDEEETQELERPEFAIFVMDECPNGSGSDFYVYMEQEQFEEHFIYVRDLQEECPYIEVTSYEGVERSGYWGGSQVPEGYNYP